MDVGLLILSLSVPVLVGWRILSLFFSGTSNSWLEKFFFAYGIGFGCMTLVMFYFSLLHIYFNVKLMMLVFLVPLIFIPRNNPITFPDKAKHVSSSSRDTILVRAISFVLFLFIVGNISTVFFRTMVVDFDIWDSWAFWAFKAKIFYVHNIIPLEMFQEFKNVWGNWDYPMHVPLMETWVLLCVGYWNDILPRILFPLFYTGICVCGFSFLRGYLPVRSSLVGTSFLASLVSLQNYTIGTIAEPVLLFYYFVSFLLLCRWMEYGGRPYLSLSAIFAGFALWTKSEALVLIVCNILIMVFYILSSQNPQAVSIRNVGESVKKIWGVLQWYIFIIVVIIAPWNIFKIVENIQNVAFNNNYFQIERLPVYAARIIEVPYVLGFQFLNLYRWNLLWIFVFFSFVYGFKLQKAKVVNWILLAIILQCAIYSFGYVTIPWDEEIYVNDTMIRLMMAPALLAILYVNLTLFREV